MSISTQFIATKNSQILDKDASLRPLAVNSNKELMKAKTLELSEQIGEFQNILYAQQKHKLLIVLQGMDTSGKDGTVRVVFGRTNPAGVRSISFKAPSTIERARDFLWRIHQQVPAAGELAIFNRSHYEDVLITKVHGDIDEAGSTASICAHQCIRAHVERDRYHHLEILFAYLPRMNKNNDYKNV